MKVLPAAKARVKRVRRSVVDTLVMFRDVQLYRPESLVDYEAQWQARLGDGSSYSSFENYRDPMGVDDVNMRGDDAFLLQLIPEGASVLELGCGNGRLGQILRDRRNVEYVGIDISEAAVAVGTSLDLECYAGNLDDFEDPVYDKIRGRRFDFVLSVWVLQILSRQEELLPKLFEFTDTQLHAVWNAGHWSSRLRMAAGRFPIYSYSADKEGRHIYPYPYGQYNRHWTFKDFPQYARQLGCRARAVGVGTKFPLRTAGLKRRMILPGLRSGRVMWELKRPQIDQ